MLGRQGMKFRITRATKGSKGESLCSCMAREAIQLSRVGCIPFITELQQLAREDDSQAWFDTHRNPYRLEMLDKRESIWIEWDDHD